MWCTRWFLPLLLLPLPTASPYFLFLFFFSLTLHARPCFYCIILLTALFTSSCYWQPVPTHSLFQSTFSNITSDAPLWFQPNASLSDESAISQSQLRPMPRLTRLFDRCWCDLSRGKLFDPYNVTLWQLASLSHNTLGGVDSWPVLISQEVDTPEGERNVSGPAEMPKMARAWILKRTGTDAPRPEEDAKEVPAVNGSFTGWLNPAMPFSWPSKISFRFPFGFGRRTPPPAVSPSAEIVANSTEDRVPPLLRRKYDLRPHGIDLIVDFGWGRTYD